MMTVGGFFANSRRRCWPPRMRDELLVDDLHDLLGRVERLVDLVAQRALAHLAGELLDDLERDVGVEQGAADLADGAVDIRRGELALGAEVAEGRGEAIREGAECCHGANQPNRWSRARPVRGAEPPARCSAPSSTTIAMPGMTAIEQRDRRQDAVAAAHEADDPDDGGDDRDAAPRKNSAMYSALSPSLPSSAAEMPLTKLKYMSATAPTASRIAMTAGAAERRSPAVWCEVSDMLGV